MLLKSNFGELTDEFKAYAEEKPEYAKLFVTYQELELGPQNDLQNCDIDQLGQDSSNNINNYVGNHHDNNVGEHITPTETTDNMGSKVKSE